MYSLAIFGAVLALVVVLNEREIWAGIRFGRLMAVPLVWIYGGAFFALHDKYRAIAKITVSTLTGMIVSQFVFGYYRAKIY